MAAVSSSESVSIISAAVAGAVSGMILEQQQQQQQSTLTIHYSKLNRTS